MTNLEIMNFDLGKKYNLFHHSNKDINKVIDLISFEDCDVVFLQGTNALFKELGDNLDYTFYVGNRTNTATLVKPSIEVISDTSYYGVSDVMIGSYEGEKIAFINTNLKTGYAVNDLVKALDKYTDLRNSSYMENIILAGNFPKEQIESYYHYNCFYDVISNMKSDDSNRGIIVTKSLKVDETYSFYGFMDTYSMSDSYPVKALIKSKCN